MTVDFVFKIDCTRLGEGSKYLMRQEDKWNRFFKFVPVRDNLSSFLDIFTSGGTSDNLNQLTGNGGLTLSVVENLESRYEVSKKKLRDTSIFP